MPLYQAIVLGVVQGLTEFLPVSSTAHLWLFPWLLHWTDPGLAFDVALHVGTLIAVVIYFFPTWIDLLMLGFGLSPPEHPRRDPDAPDLRRDPLLFWFLVLGTIPAALAGWRFEELADTTWRQPVIIGTAFIVIGLLMGLGEKVGREIKPLETVGFLDSLVIGVSQALALIPGVSRSGITMTTGLFRDLDRPAAAQFSFLLSTPIIAGAALKTVLNLHRTGIPAGMATPALAGVLVSAIVGYATIAYFLRFLQFGTFKFFVYYRVVLGIIVLALAFFIRA